MLRQEDLLILEEWLHRVVHGLSPKQRQSLWLDNEPCSKHDISGTTLPLT